MPRGVAARVAAWALRHPRGWMVPQPSGPLSPGAVTFPTTSLSCRVYLAIGADLTQPYTSWVWTDITGYVRFASGISTSQGRPDWTSTVRTSSGALVLDNRDGRFTRRNPAGPYFGSLTFNTPIWATVDPGSGPVTRMAMFVNEWPTRWGDRSGRESNVPIQCAGIMRRLQQGIRLKSPMRRRVLSVDEPTPIAYWPMEDASGSTIIGSGLPGGSAMVGTPTFGTSFGGTAGSIDLGSMADGALVTNVTLSAATGMQVEFIVHHTDSTLVAVLEVLTGTLDATLAVSSSTADGVGHHLAYKFVQNGSNVDVTTYRDGTLVSTTPLTGIMSTSVRIVTRSGGIAVSMAHLAVYDPATMNAPTTRGPAANGYNGELATTRIRRLCAEERVPVVCTSGLSVAMGIQSTDTFLNLLHECEAADQGVLYEANWGLAYQSCNDRSNEPATMALDFDSRHIAIEPQPADDDQRLRNRWTVSRTNGSEATKERTSGPLGTQAGGPGVYQDSATVNVQTDSQLPDQAGWRLNLGTVDEDRWPSIPLRFHGTPDLIPTWTQMQVGSRLTIAHPPDQVAPDTIDAVMEGWSERWDPESWSAELTTSPFSPYRVGTLAADTGDTSEFLLILTPDTLTLNTAVNTTDTSWSINSSPVWTTASESFPRRIMWEGEEIRLTACSGASAPQTWTVVRSVNGVVKSHAAGTSGKILHPGVLGLA